MKDIMEKIQNLQNIKQEMENQLKEQMSISQIQKIKIEQDQGILTQQQIKLKAKKLDNNQKQWQLKNLEEKLLSEKYIILNKIMKDNFNTENWDNFIKGIKLTGVAFKGGIKGSLCSTAGLAGSGLAVGVGTLAIATGADLSGCGGGSSSRSRSKSVTVPFGLGVGGGVVSGVFLGVGIACPVTLPVTIPIPIASGGISVVTGSIAGGACSVNKKLKKWSSPSKPKLSSDLILNKIKYLQTLNCKNEDKSKENLAKNLIEIEQDLLKNLMEQKKQMDQLLAAQKELDKEINLISSEILKKKAEVAKTNEPIQVLEKEIFVLQQTIQKLEDHENQVNELLAAVQQYEPFADTFISQQQNQRSPGL